MIKERTYWRWDHKTNAPKQYTSIYEKEELERLSQALGHAPVCDTEEECTIDHLQGIVDGRPILGRI